MIKSFILAATSIACILSIADIVDAKVPATPKKVKQDLGCQNQTSSSNQVNPIPIKDLRDICKILNKKFKENNEVGILYQSRNEGEFLASEVKSLKLVSDYYLVNSPEALVEVRYIRRIYKWKGFWKLGREVEDGVVVRFYKVNGKWVNERASHGPLAKLPQGWVEM